MTSPFVKKKHHYFLTEWTCHPYQKSIAYRGDWLTLSIELASLDHEFKCHVGIELTLKTNYTQMYGLNSGL